MMKKLLIFLLSHGERFCPSDYILDDLHRQVICFEEKHLRSNQWADPIQSESLTLRMLQSLSMFLR